MVGFFFFWIIKNLFLKGQCLTNNHTRSRFPEKPKNGQHLPYKHRKRGIGPNKNNNCQPANQSQTSPHTGHKIDNQLNRPKTRQRGKQPRPQPGLRYPRIPNLGKTNKPHPSHNQPSRVLCPGNISHCLGAILGRVPMRKPHEPNQKPQVTKSMKWDMQTQGDHQLTLPNRTNQKGHITIRGLTFSTCCRRGSPSCDHRCCHNTYLENPKKTKTTAILVLQQ